MEPIGFIPAIKYVDVIFVIIILVITKFKFYPAPKPIYSIRGFIEDDFNPEVHPDILGREKYAIQISVKILATSTLRKAFVIAINSPWGFGKTGFLLLMEHFFKLKKYERFQDILTRYSDFALDSTEMNQLFDRHKDVVIVRYNPWNNFDDKKTLQVFFDEFSSQLNVYDSTLSKRIKSYGRYLDKLDDSVFSKVVELTIESFYPDETLADLFKEINNSIGRIQKKIIVFVDDLDRLNGDELIDILKLIRNTANFVNTFFIVAFDHNYVLNTINKSNLISSKEEYLQKIVQLEISLPLFQRNVLVNYLQEQLFEYENAYLGQYGIKSAIDEILAINVLSTPASGSAHSDSDDLSDFFFRSRRSDDSLLFHIFQNKRDVVRFVNSFKLSLEAIGLVCDVYELILLDALKTRYLSVYQMVSKRKFLKIVNQKFEFNYDEFDNFWASSISSESFNIKLLDVPVIRVLLESIFSPKRKLFFRSVKFPSYFDIYFTFNSPKLIQLQSIEAALDARDENQIFNVIDQAAKDVTFEDLRNFLDSKTDFEDRDEFEFYLKILFHIAKYDYIK